MKRITAALLCALTLMLAISPVFALTDEEKALIYADTVSMLRHLQPTVYARLRT